MFDVISGPTRAQGYAMRHGTTATAKIPAAPLVEQPIDPEIVEFREAFEARARSTRSFVKVPVRCFSRPLRVEVDDFVAHHADRRDEHRQRLVVRNGYFPSRELLSGAGPLQVKQPRVRDNAPTSEDRVCFSPSVLPPYLRRSKSVDELIPWLYLKGISTGDFSEALCGPAGQRRTQSQPERHRSTQGEMVAGIRGVEST